MGRTAKYQHAHKQERKLWAAAMQRNGGWNCSETICLEVTRWIPWGQPWDLAHAPGDTGYLGPAHRRCNRSEGGIRGNQKLKRPRRMNI